ncbi:MAG TPA: glycosyltransferase family 39 protein [Blastocatellia bacterium]|nr:glycosyltransferase family 39 protein [Blastocatellia bacterium]
MALSCVIIFSLALIVRLLYWQDASAEIARGDSTIQALAATYRDEAKRMLEQKRVLFPRDPIDPGDARPIVHPPAYSVLMAAMTMLFGDPDKPLRITQVVLAAAGAVIVVLIAAELLPFAIAVMAGLIVALSPHLAYYSIFLSPDSLTVLPILIAVYLIARAAKRPHIMTVVAAGLSLGLSCWLRSNALLLMLFLSLAVLLSFKKGTRLRYSLALTGSALLVIMPLTIRNLIVYGHFIPISVGAGLNLMEGIAEYDYQGRFDLPVVDPDVLSKEVEWHGRPDYGASLYFPDGIERDRDRLARAATVVRSNPGWFTGVMLRRMLFMLRYNDFRFRNPIANAPTAPAVSASPGFGHDIGVPIDVRPVWSRWMTDASTSFVAAEASVSRDLLARRLEIAADGSELGDQFISEPISLDKATDYILTIQIKQAEGALVAKVRTEDPRIVLATTRIAAKNRKGRNDSDVDDGDANSLDRCQLQFATANATEVRIAIANNRLTAADRASLDHPFVQLGRADLFRIGATPYAWTRYARSVIRGIQKNLYKTEWMWLLISAGIVLLAVARRRRALFLLLAVPIYYLTVHSAVHTEYRYILAIHCFLPVLAATALYSVASLTLAALRRQSTTDEHR